MVGGLMFVRWALVEREVEPRVETEAWWRQRATRREKAPGLRPPTTEPIPVEELRDRLRVLGWS
jgi:hypothetical protein